MRLLSPSHVYRLIGLSVLVGTALVTQNCQCQRSSSIPDAPQTRLTTMTEMLPDKTGGIGAIGDLETFRQQGATFKKSIDDIFPIAKMVERNVQSRFGLNIFEGKSWKKAGIDPDGSVVVADVGGRPVLLVYYTDKQSFETHLTDQLQSTFGLEGAPTSKSVGDHTLKVLGESSDQQVAWGYDGRLAVVAFPPTWPTVDVSKTDPVTSTVQTILETSPEASLAQRETFEQFRSFSSENTSFVFLDTDELADRQLQRTSNPNSPAARSSRYLKHNFNGLGAVLEPQTSGLTMHTWLGLKPDVASAIEKLRKKVTSAQWKHLATDQTLIGLRFGFPPGSTLEAALQQSTESERRAVRRRLQRIGDALGVDVEKEVLGNLTGQIGLFFYGFGPNLSLGDVRRNPMKTLRQTGLIVAATFEDSKSLRSLLQTVAESNNFLRYRDLKPGDGSTSSSIKVLEFQSSDETTGLSRLMSSGLANLPVRLYAHENRLVASTTAIGESSMQGYLTGSREEASSLADSENLELGRRFTSEPKLTGLYLSVARAREVLQGKLPPLPAINRVFNQLEELLVTMEPHKHGAVLELEIDRTTKSNE